MRRVVCVWFPTFAADLVWRRLQRRQASQHCPSGWSADRPGVGAGPRSPAPSSRPLTLLIRRIASREIVASACTRAARAGVAPGMDMAQARSLLPPGLSTDAQGHARLHLEEHRPERDAASLHALACWMTRFAPTVAPDGIDGLLLDVSGTQRLHGGESRLLRALAAALARLGFRSRIAGAPTFACAWAVSRFGPHDLSLVPPARERDAMAALPVAALRLDPPIVEGLEQVGVTRVGQVLNLSRSALAARFDPTLLDRIDKALGRSIEVVEGVHPEPPPRAELLFDGPTDQWESVEAAARQVVGDMARLLEGLERGVRRLEVEMSRPSAPPERFVIALSRPSRSARHLWSLLRARLERIDLGQGVEGITLIAPRTARLRHRQAASASLGASGLQGRAETDEITTQAAWGELVDALAGRLGADGVVRIEAVESHLPERAWRERSALEEDRPAALAPNKPSRRTTRAASAQRPDFPHPIAALADRPTILFPKPEPADVLALTPDGPVLEVGWRGQRQRVLACTGPERIAPEWWRWGSIDLESPAADHRGPTKGVMKQEMAVPPFSPTIKLALKTEGPCGCGEHTGRGNPHQRLTQTRAKQPGPTERPARPARGRGPPAPPPPPDRDYFAVQLEDGRWIWMCRQVGAGRWYIHGQWG